MSKAIHSFWWGLVLIFLDINFGFIDILPDVIGYICIALAFEGLQEAIPKARQGRRVTVGILGFHIIACLLLWTKPDEPLVTYTLQAIYGVSLIVIIYYLCEVVHQLLGAIAEGAIKPQASQFEAASYNLTYTAFKWQGRTEGWCKELQIAIRSKWKGCLYVGFISCCINAFSLNAPDDVILISAFMSFLMITFTVALLCNLASIRRFLVEELKL